MQAIISSPMTSGNVRESMAVAAELPSRQHRIRRLNDHLRATFTSGRVMLTAGVTALDDKDQARVLLAVNAFDGFTPANDPYGEHDFGRIEVGGRGYFFKIDYYDIDFQYQSPDPADTTVTSRVMTIMREDEY